MNKISIQVNGEKMSVDADISLEKLLSSLEINHDHVSVAVNDEVISRESLSNHRLRNEDQVEIIHFVGGGGRI